MKRIYIKPVAEELSCDMSGMLAASPTTPTTPTTEWEMNPDGHNGTGIVDGAGKDPDADADAGRFGGFFDEY